MAKEPAAPESEFKRIQPTHGPYAGTQIDIPTADADAAIADGWAIDPFAPVDPKAEPKEFSQEDHDKATAAAEKAVRKMRGEPEPAENENKKKPAAADESEERKAKASAADESGESGATYQTRRSTPAPAKPKT